MNEKLRILKLINNEELVGEIEEETEEKYRVKNPCNLGITVNESGQPALSMTPMLFFSEQKVVELKKSHVLYNVSVATEIQNRYNQVYGAGIVIPKTNQIIS